MAESFQAAAVIFGSVILGLVGMGYVVPIFAALLPFLLLVASIVCGALAASWRTGAHVSHTTGSGSSVRVWYYKVRSTEGSSPLDSDLAVLALFGASFFFLSVLSAFRPDIGFIAVPAVGIVAMAAAGIDRLRWSARHRNDVRPKESP